MWGHTRSFSAHNCSWVAATNAKWARWSTERPVRLIEQPHAGGPKHQSEQVALWPLFDLWPTRRSKYLANQTGPIGSVWAPIGSPSWPFHCKQRLSPAADSLFLGPPGEPAPRPLVLALRTPRRRPEDARKWLASAQLPCQLHKTGADNRPTRPARD